MKLLLSPVTAVTCDTKFRVIKDASIQIEDGAISYVGPRTEAPDFAPDETIGGEHLVALPGLVNTHAHNAMTLLRGWADDKPLEAWLSEDIWPFEANLQLADIVAGTELALCEMLRGGTTTVADMYFGYEKTVESYIASGMRACPGAVLLGFLPGADEKIARGKEFVRDFAAAGDGRISPFFAPHSLYTCDRAQWQTIIEAARELGALIHTHIAETTREVADVTKSWGASPIQTLQNIGAFDGPLHAAHCVHLDGKDWDVVQSTVEDGAFRVAHNPSSNLKLASGFAPVMEFLRRGVPTGIATDGAASNNDLDMWEEMRLAAFIHKAATGDATAVSAREALLMATREGARCLNLPQIGALQTGWRADICLMNFDAAHLTPNHSVVSNLVYAAKASDVATTIVDGKVLFRNGELKTLDEARIKHDARESAARLAVAARTSAGSKASGNG
ncbi:MAG TPA: amidohydrolase [Abditibacteriaceae bacterium]|jgi:5-methylthioadenosine/S-adenosylhomocysteine deaminase